MSNEKPNADTTSSSTSKINWSNSVHLKLSNEPANISIGPLQVWLRSVNSEIWLAHKTITDPSELPASNENMVSELTWVRWALDLKYPEVKILAVMPDRPLVVHPDYEFRLPKKSSAKIYVRVPIRAKLEIAATNLPLIEIDTVRLSNTWFGDFISGELCYWVAASARRSVYIDPDAQHLCICPIFIRNLSGEELLVQRIRLNTDGLAIYQQAGQLWSSETTVNFKGGYEGSEVDIKSGVPSDANLAKLLTTPRVPASKSGVFKTFGRIFDLSSLGL